MNMRCIYCSSNAVVKYGRYKNHQRYFCKFCRRKFKDDKSPFHMKVPSYYVTKTLEMYYSNKRMNDICAFFTRTYHHPPTKTALYQWIRKFSRLAIRYYGEYAPGLSQTWILDSTSMVVGQHEVCIYDLVDEKSKFLISSRFVFSRSKKEAARTLYQAFSVTNRLPKYIITDVNNTHLDIKVYNNHEVKYSLPKIIKPVTDAPSLEVLLSDRFLGTLEDGSEVIRSFRNDRALERFVAGWLIYYNFFKPNPLLNGQTPAEAARIDYKFKNWHDFITGIFRE